LLIFEYPTVLQNQNRQGRVGRFPNTSLSIQVIPVIRRPSALSTQSYSLPGDKKSALRIGLAEQSTRRIRLRPALRDFDETGRTPGFSSHGKGGDFLIYFSNASRAKAWVAF
jgi:hypothetical protein